MTMARSLTGLTIAVVAMAATPALAQAGDAAKGKIVFARCALCHDVKPGPKKMAQSARSCDFGHVEEQRLNMAIYQARSCPPIS